MTHSRPRRSRIAHFRQPFLVGVASSAVALGCGAQVDGELGVDSSEVTAENGQCPSPTPRAGDRCDTEGMYCGDGCAGTSVYCDGTVFVAAPSSCNPPPPEPQPDPPLAECPSSGLLAAGQACTSEGLSCGDACAGPVMTCQDGQFQETVWSCNPPPPPDLISNPPAPAVDCPEDMPQAGSSCQGSGTCGYSGCEGPESSTATCRFNQWVVVYSAGPACNPPAVVPVCPELRPTDGAGCVYAQDCDYGDCVRASCDGELWTVSASCAEADAGAEPVETDGVDAGL